MILTLCIDKQEKNNPSELKREYPIEIGDRLCSCDGVYDELIITLNDVNQLDGIVKRRCNIDRFDIITKLQEEYTQTLEIPEITLFEGTNYIYIKEFSNLNMKIEYLTNVEMNQYYAKSAEVKAQLIITADQIKSYVGQIFQTKEGAISQYSQIQQQMNSITQTVAETYETKSSAQTNYSQIQQTTNSISQTVSNNNTKANIIAKINDNTSQAKINADVVDIDANDVLNILSGNAINMTTKNISFNSTNFNVDKNGNATMNNATVNGKVTATEGSIGGWTVNSQGLTNGTVFLHNDGSSTIYTVADLIIIRNYIMGVTGFDLSPAMIRHYDLNKDGVVTSQDYVMLQNLIGISMN